MWLLRALMINNTLQLFWLLSWQIATHMHPKIYYEGKIDLCHPALQFPEGRNVSYSVNHWLNEASMIQCLNEIVIVFLKLKPDALTLPQPQ